MIQGIMIPLLQITVMYQLYQFLLPDLHRSLHLSRELGFLISFIGIDYIYYWNHRLLHHPLFWKIHQVHHTVSEMDILGTSRNTLWSSFFIIYLWLNPLIIYLLDDSSGYVLGVSLTAALDLWRHSSLYLPMWLQRLLVPWLVLPIDHAWHHASDATSCNFGANLAVWDRWHGTYRSHLSKPASLGTPTSLTLIQQLFYPL